MRLIVTCERRFLQTPDGAIWTTSIDDASFWSRYLDVYDEVVVVSRVTKAETPGLNMKPVSGSGVLVHPIPTFNGPVQYLANQMQIKGEIKKILSSTAAVIIRGPGSIGFALRGILKRQNHPFGLEMTGDPRQMYSRGVLSHPLRPLLRYLIIKYTLDLARNACAVSYVTSSHLQNFYKKGPNAYSTWYSSVSLPDNLFDHEPCSHTPNHHRVIIASVGSMEQAYKGFDDLIKAAKVLRQRGHDIQLLIIGGGRKLFEYQALANSLSVPTEFTGELPGQEAVRKELARANLFVLPSKSEGLPRVVIEAMALGIPCIATDVGGTAELLAPEHIVPPADINQLVIVIETMLRNKVSWHDISIRNWRKAEDFKESVLVRKRQDFYIRVLNETNNYYLSK